MALYSYKSRWTDQCTRCACLLVTGDQHIMLTSVLVLDFIAARDTVGVAGRVMYGCTTDVVVIHHGLAVAYLTIFFESGHGGFDFDVPCNHMQVYARSKTSLVDSSVCMLGRVVIATPVHV